MQSFPINFTSLLAQPELVILSDQGQESTSFTYQEDYFLVPEVIGSGGDVFADLVWVRDGTYQGMNLDGAVVVRRPFNPLIDEVTRAIEHGAGGLILVGNLQIPRSLSKDAIPQELLYDAPIPVIELTSDGFDRLLEITNHSEHNFNTSPPAILPTFWDCCQARTQTSPMR
jgi:hypothetical protein